MKCGVAEGFRIQRLAKASQEELELQRYPQMAKEAILRSTMVVTSKTYFEN